MAARKKKIPERIKEQKYASEDGGYIVMDDADVNARILEKKQSIRGDIAGNGM